MRNMASYDLRQIVSALDDMNKAVYKIQHSTEVIHLFLFVSDKKRTDSDWILAKRKLSTPAKSQAAWGIVGAQLRAHSQQ